MFELDLDSSKILYHINKLKKWNKGERVYPITIDMCLSRFCQYKCEYCYGMMQKNKGENITWDIAKQFLDDCKEIDVKAISLVSDAESTCNPIYKDFIIYCKNLGIDIALGTNGHLLNREVLEEILPKMEYLRFNISAGDPKRYAEIHGVTIEHYHKVKWNILDAVEIKKQNNLDCAVSMQMVCMPQYKDDILPLVEMAINCEVDYLVIKHCSDNEDGYLGVDYSKYKELYDVFEQAEAMSTDKTKIQVKWNKIKDGNKKQYKKCLAPPLHLQISGSGLVTSCGMFFADKYKKYHIGNFCKTRFKDIVNSDRYWEVMDYLASDKFNAQTDCGTLCIQHLSNIVLNDIKNGKININDMKQGDIPKGCNFI